MCESEYGAGPECYARHTKKGTNKKAGAHAPALMLRPQGNNLSDSLHAVAGTLPGFAPAGVPPPGGVLPPPVEP